jgi:Asp-tRNA(Asn)/Glu-tRNA(Gln) amidotransferase B subunit
VEREGLRQVSDAGALEAVIDKVIAENPGPVAQFRGGKEGALNALIGPVMKETGKAANAQVVRDLLRKRLEG